MNWKKFRKKYFAVHNEPPRYRICRNRFGYFKVQREYWCSFFGRWGKFGINWADERGQQMNPRVRPAVLKFRHRKEAIDYIKGEQEKRRMQNNDWGCGQIFK